VYWRSPDSFRGGAVLALGMLIKPLFAILALVPALQRRWRPIAGFAAGAALSWILAAAAFGPGTVASYFTEKPHDKLPAAVLLEGVNQSVSSLCLKLGARPFGHSPVLTLPFLLAAFILTAVTAWAIIRCPERESRWAFCLAVLLALLVYPGSQTHYGVLALPAMFLLWTDRERFPGGALPAAVAIAVVYALDALGLVLFGNLILWVLMLAMWPGRLVK
jgi:hypothetical protein